MKIQYQTEDLIIFESALIRTTTTLIIGKDYLLLVDPNWLPVELDFIEETIVGLGDKKEKFLLFTHSDYDHIIGYGKFKDYTTIASANFVHSPSKQKVVKEMETFDDEYYIKRTYNLEYPRIDRSVAGEGEQLRLGSETYVFYQARGHNHDGLIAVNSDKKILIVGDYLCKVEFPYIYYSVQLYLETLSKLEKLIREEEISLLIAGHGDVTRDRREMLSRVEESRHYINQLIDAVSSGKTFDEDALLAKYDFPMTMRQFHIRNVELAEKEYKSRVL